MQNEIIRIVMGYENKTIVTFLNQGEGGTLIMTIAKSLNQKKNKITHKSTHRSKQTNTKSANIKINKKIVKICSKFKVDNCTQVRLSSG